MPQEISSLVRAIGRWSLAALMLNTIIGASIFGLPSLLAAHLGRFSPAGYLVTAVGIAAIAGGTGLLLSYRSSMAARRKSDIVAELMRRKTAEASAQHPSVENPNVGEKP